MNDDNPINKPEESAGKIPLKRFVIFSCLTLFVGVFGAFVGIEMFATSPTKCWWTGVATAIMIGSMIDFFNYLKGI